MILQERPSLHHLIESLSVINDGAGRMLIEGIKIKTLRETKKLTEHRLQSPIMIIAFDFCNASPRQCNNCALG